MTRASKRKDLVEKFQVEYSNEDFELIVNSFRGLTLSECEQICAYCKYEVKLAQKYIHFTRETKICQNFDNFCRFRSQ